MVDRDVRVVAFDVNETLFALDNLGPAFTDVGLDPGLVPVWFLQVLRDGFALTAMGEYQPFVDLAGQSLRSLSPATIDDAAVEAVLAAFRQLDPHPDVEPALAMLYDAGMPAITLTNGSADVVRVLLERAGLARFVQANLSVDVVRRWKPAREPYVWAADVVGVEPSELALVATHPWDCAGAGAAGLTACWVTRGERPWPASFATPYVTGPDLPAVVTSLISR